MASRRATKRDKQRDKLVEENLYIVAPIARMVTQQAPSEFEFEDLESIGKIALIECADRYKPSEHGGAPFSAYARMRVRGAMLDSIKGRHYVRVKSTDSLDAEGAVEPAIAATNTEEAIDHSRRLAKVYDTIAKLEDDRSREVLTLHYKVEMKRAEIAALYGVHESRISHLHQLAIQQLRTALNIETNSD